MKPGMLSRCVWISTPRLWAYSRAVDVQYISQGLRRRLRAPHYRIWIPKKKPNADRAVPGRIKIGRAHV